MKKVEKKAEKVENSQSVQKAQEKNAEEKASDNEVIIPFSKEKNHINGTKKEISVAVSADGTVKKLPNKKNFVLKIPDSYYREYDAAAQDKGPVIAGKRVEIIDKRSPEKKPENAQKPSRVDVYKRQEFHITGNSRSKSHVQCRKRCFGYRHGSL